jgi:putative glutamine amidotransferase
MDDNVGLKTGLGTIGQEWNLVANDYIIAIERAGGIPIILPITEYIENSLRILNMIDGILFTGGSDIDPQCYSANPRYGLQGINPKRDKHELSFVKQVLYKTNLPILGICRGMQLLTVATGGTLYQDLHLERSEGFMHNILDVPKYHPTHTVAIERGSLFHKIFSQEEIGVNSFHHQAVKRMGDRFHVTMVAQDGVIEGIEHNGNRFISAVQWHPEMMVEKHPIYLNLFTTFVEICLQK